jgi:hypothetical protein
MPPIWVRTGKIARAPRSPAAPTGCSATADPSGGTAAAGQLGNLLDVRDRSARAGGLGEEIENRVVVIVDGRERLIGIGSRLGVARYGQARPQEPADRADQDRVLVEGFPGEAGRISTPAAIVWKTRVGIAACYCSAELLCKCIDIWPDNWAASPRTAGRTFQTLSKFDESGTSHETVRPSPRAHRQ